ncbi:hypothetical protein MWU78_01710 [Arenibacter sp. F26102]|uniref:hypothetical protein n=1 Tax=Arenibacter sp. F26102 TaxID=2926416 RepID=UPI001FF5BD4E|nr:hypothetical protein [Arenibacter sp. F26102]MCK0144362.1 hypothetical protein [Arenibacter sp. F26102]
MKKILIPTDFSVKSLLLLDEVTKLYQDEITNVILIYGFRVPTLETELFQFSSSKIIRKLARVEFLEAKANFVNKNYCRINSISIEVFTGTNSFAFQNFRDQHQIHEAIIPEGGFLQFSGTSCFDPTKYIKKNIAKVHQVKMEQQVVEEYQKGSFIHSLLKI